jgi:hypothetical protein
MKKKLIALTIACTLLGSVAVNAAQTGVLSIDGQKIATSYAEDNTIMVPVREVSEALGYTVDWIGESKTVTLTKGAVYITCTIGTDGYTFARTAPMPLGKAPEIKDGKTLVPIELFTELAEMTASIDGTDVNIITETELKGSGIIQKAEDGTISVIDTELGEIVLHISDDTEITDVDGNALTPDAIADGCEVDVVYGDAMMDSLPPQNVPKSIVIKNVAENDANDNVTESLSITGTVSIDEDGNICVVSDDEAAPYKEVVLVVTEDTTGDNIAPKDGDKITATFSPNMTRSIPPQSTAFSINTAE